MSHQHAAAEPPAGLKEDETRRRCSRRPITAQDTENSNYSEEGKYLLPLLKSTAMLIC